MEDNVGKLFSGLGFVVVIIFALAFMLLFVDNTVDTKANEETINFVNECASLGEIEPSKYYVYATTIAGLGNYDIKMEHKAEQYFSDGNDVSRDYIGYYEDEILEYMYPDSGGEKSWEMKSGDLFTVTLKKNGSSLTTIWEELVGYSNNFTVVDYGSYVGNN